MSKKNNRPTAKLWIQYFEMVTLMKQFIQAERMGDWQLHLDCVRKMLPFFHASGHYLYAKSNHLYLQDMYDLKNILGDEEFDFFATKGYFTVRRTNRFFSGTPTDQCGEQDFMGAAKKTGSGVTTGRGASAPVITKFILSTPHMVEVSKCIQAFTQISFATSEQHVDARPARISRDYDDVRKYLKFFEKHEPFAPRNEIVCITTGMKGGENINSHEAFEVGYELLKNLSNGGFDFKSVKFQKKKSSIVSAEYTFR